ncbi:MAG: nucleotidyl transferase AbiEii/AbiGii toxin family protein [Candidatus Sabulitectum sp.]|nr:nucleotidyl transferase AbiEii/AbiGii toxin family protein [Candidatus Sabulitectum sp.]
MSGRVPTDIAASVRQKLLNYSREKKEDFNLVLTRYAQERLLYRLSKSEYADDFVLKGGLMFLVWEDNPYRVTRDMDFLGYGEDSSSRMIEVFKSLSNAEFPDGLVFDTDSVKAKEIRGMQEYNGIRIELCASLKKALIPLQIDIGFGDAIFPESEMNEFPTIMDMPSPFLHTYSRYSVVAEKYEAMVKLGIANSRMKDFSDIWMMSKMFSFDGTATSKAIRATFERRKTEIPHSLPEALTNAFANDSVKKIQWLAFVKRSRSITSPDGLEELITFIRGFLMEPTLSCHSKLPFNKEWLPGGPWGKK